MDDPLSQPPAPKMNDKCNTFLTRGETIGVVIETESGVLSVIAVLLLFYMIIRNVRRNSRITSDQKRRFFRSPLDIYMLSLFISDFIQGLGVSLSIRWIAQGNVHCGSYCTAQGVLLQLGETSVALATLAIAVHTFITIAFRRLFEGLLVPILVVSAIWLYIILFTLISMGVRTRNGEFYDSPTPYWCWVGTRFTGERIAGEYFWFWFTALVSMVLYLLVFLCLRGNIEIEPGGWIGIRIHARRRTKPKDVSPASSDVSQPENIPRDPAASRQAFDMLLYPLAYCGLILPLSIVRWISFVLEAQHAEDPNHIHQRAATFVAQGIFGLSGVVNVTLILLTRPGLLLLGEPATRPTQGPTFGSSENVSAGTTMRPPPAETVGLRLRSSRSMPAMGYARLLQRSDQVNPRIS